MTKSKEFIELTTKNMKENHVRIMFRELVGCEKIKDQFIEELVNMYFGKVNKEDLEHLLKIARKEKK